MDNWKYKKKITITGQTGAGTDYQVRLDIGNSSSATGDDFHLEGNSDDFPTTKNDGGDLNFTADDQTTELDFWVEKVTGSGASAVATVWVKVSDDLGSNQDIYCFYGNASASNLSDPDSTFLFFDDFDGSSLDTDNWTVTSGTGDSVSSSVVTLTGDGATSTKVVSDTSFPVSRKIRWNGRIDQSAASIHIYGLDGDPKFFSGFTTQPSVHADNGGTDVDTTIDAPYTGDWEIRRNSSGHAEFYIDDSLTNTLTDTNTSSNPFAFSVFDSGNTVTVDYIFVAKQADTEPTFSTAGNQEATAFLSVFDLSPTMYGITGSNDADVTVSHLKITPGMKGLTVKPIPPTNWTNESKTSTTWTNEQK